MPQKQNILCALSAMTLLAACASDPKFVPSVQSSWNDLLNNGRQPQDTTVEATTANDTADWLAEVDRRRKADADRLAKQPKVEGAFVDLAIRDALFEISQQAKIPVVVDPTVEGTVMLQFKNTPFETALRLIAFSGGFSYSTDGQAYYVGTADPETPSFGPLTTSRVISTYHPADSLAESLTEDMRKYVSFAKGSKKIMLTGPLPLVQRLEDDIRLLDKPPPQIEIEVLIVEKKWGDEFDIGNAWEEMQANIEHTFSTAASPTKQLEVITQVALMFNLLEKKSLAKIHSHPKIMTTNGTPAEIRAETEAYVIITTPGVAVLQTDLEIIKAGTVLKVTPVLTRNNEIELTLEPEVSDAIGVAPQGIGGLPIVTRRGSKNTVRLKSGDIMAIGGLFREQDNEEHQGFPFLKDIPVIDLVAGERKRTAVQSELLIFVSPRLVR